MRRSALTGACALVALALAAATAAMPSSQATLRLIDNAPIAVRGTGFMPGEQVMVRVTRREPSSRWSRAGTAATTGTVTVRFRRVSLDLCSGMTITATGSMGSRAAVKLPQPQCPAP